MNPSNDEAAVNGSTKFAYDWNFTTPGRFHPHALVELMNML